MYVPTLLLQGKISNEQNRNHLFCGNASFLIGTYCQLLGVGKGYIFS